MNNLLVITKESLVKKLNESVASLPKELPSDVLNRIKARTLIEDFSTPGDLLLDFTNDSSPEMYFLLGRLLAVTGEKQYLNVVGLNNNSKDFCNLLFHYLVNLDSIRSLGDDKKDKFMTDLLESMDGSNEPIVMRINPEDPNTLIYFGVLSNLRSQNTVFTRSDEELPEDYQIVLSHSNRHIIGSDKDFIPGTDLFE